MRRLHWPFWMRAWMNYCIMPACINVSLSNGIFEDHFFRTLSWPLMQLKIIYWHTHFLVQWHSSAYEHNLTSFFRNSLSELGRRICIQFRAVLLPILRSSQPSIKILEPSRKIVACIKPSSFVHLVCNVLCHYSLLRDSAFSKTISRSMLQNTLSSHNFIGNRNEHLKALPVLQTPQMHPPRCQKLTFSVYSRRIIIFKSWSVWNSNWAGRISHYRRFLFWFESNLAFNININMNLQEYIW